MIDIHNNKPVYDNKQQEYEISMTNQTAKRTKQNKYKPKGKQYYDLTVKPHTVTDVINKEPIYDYEEEEYENDGTGDKIITQPPSSGKVGSKNVKKPIKIDIIDESARRRNDKTQLGKV